MDKYNNISELLESDDFKQFLKEESKLLIGDNFIDNICSKGIPKNRITMFAGKSNLKGLIEKFLEQSNG